jgi:2-polyprenyl-3-methyl-5-hydroxy-6-metoxy-1,4-benzoquinol methylase
MPKNDPSADVEKMYFYESFAEQFDSKMNMYDLRKRVAVVFDELLGGHELGGKTLLDAGCGTGWFSKRAVERGAVVTSMDLGENLLGEVAKKCESHRVIGSILEMPFPDNHFDYVISSEVIEHVPAPHRAIDELYRVLKPGGTLVITTPNRVWHFSVSIANRLKLRPYQGLENWVGYAEMRKKFEQLGLRDIRMKGIHLFPFVSPLFYPILDRLHRWGKTLGPLMVNLAVSGKK